MGVSDENFNDVMRPSNGVSREIGGKGGVGGRRNRNPLSTLDANIVPVARLGKRGLSTGQNEVADKANVLGHMVAEARKLPAVQMAEKQKRTVVEDRRLPPLKSDKSKRESENCRVNIVTENPRPTTMVVQHTEAMLEENDQMDAEIEMKEDDEELVMDIDSADKNNPLAVVEYIDDLYAYYKKLESSSCVPPNYMVQQLDINERMRGILIDWLIEVHYKFELMEETLYLIVNLIDRFLAIQKVERKKLQLVGVTALLLACKYEEVYVPVVEDLILISDKAYTRNEILDMERSMTFSLQFNLSTPTPYVFMRRFLKAARADLKLEHLSFFMIELCLVEYEMLEFPPSLLAAAAVFTAQATLTRTTKWCKTCEKHTNYSEDQLLECSRLMVSFHEKASTGKLIGVHRKYSTSKYGYAAKTVPAHFLLES